MVWTDINLLPQILGILCIFVILGYCNEEYDISGHHGQGCHPKLFECVSGECLDFKYHCDGIEQCKDKSDEENCDFYNCIGPNWFKCKTGRCIKQTFLCDGNDDCNDFSDEKNCHDTYEHFVTVSDCPPSKFKCVKDGSCIPENWACDGHANCIDGSDEVEGCMGKVHCNGNIFCNNTHHCIEKDFLCDGVDDCGDGEDETNCFNNVALNDCTIENHKFQCKDKSHCIDLDKVCDHTPDCFDLSDENGKCYDINQCVLAKCPNNCSLTPTGPVCFCPYGSKLVGENCIDIDECLEFGKCDQHCLNIKNGYNCFCEPGYELASDGHTCIVEDGEGLLLFTTQNQIFGFTLKSETYFPISHVNRAIGVAYDGQYVYWTNTVNTIVRSLKNGSDLTVVVDSGLLLPEDLAIDLITKNIYFTDSIQQHIGVCSNDGFSCTILHNKDIDKPRGICLQIKEGLMYWTDWGARPLIARSGMDGSDVTDFVTTNLDWPNGITIDYGNDRLYWVDAKQLVIESIKLDGSDRRMVLDKAALKHPFSVAVFEDSLYWSDLEGNEIQACNKFTGKNVRSIVRQTKNLIYGIHVYHDSIKHSHSLENPCKYAGCTDMCLLAPVSRPLRYTCACPEDKFLAANGHQCNSGKRFPSIMVGIGNTLIQVEPKKLGKMKFHENVLSEVEKIGALAYDELTGNIIISDSAAKKFFAVDLNTGYSTHLLSGDIGKVEGIDVDPLGHNMYWVDSERLTVEIISLKSLERTVLLRDFGGDSPVDIALAPNKGFMFIALSGPRGTYIDRFYMNGHNRVHLVDSDLTGPAINLAYNKYADKLFWVDSGSGLIERGDIDGLERYSFIKSYNTPKLLTTLENGIFWVSYGIPSLEYANIFEENPVLKEIALNVKIGSDYLRITAVKDRIAAASHRCQTNNGGCSHFCLIIPNDNVCGCPNGLSLQTDGLTCEKPIQCSTRQFHCKTGECIPDSLRCDYKNDCPEGDDELHCTHYSIPCPKGQFSCLNGEKCVDDQEKCNGHAVCYDGSDEHNCHLLNMSCYQGNFKCGSGECIVTRFKCDGHQDCNDASDEDDCEKVTCGSNEFRCINGGCIPSSWECDGEFDCKDGSDEANSKCESKKTCSPTSFRCDNGGCVESILRCNGADDCGDSSDESVCLSQYFNNDDDFDNLNTDIAGHIIDDSITLEVIHNCKEKSEFKCDSQPEKCLPIEAKCNGTSECLRGEDETNCSGCSNDEFECVENKRCILREWICDNTNDCIDNSDEDPFMCKYHNKTLLTKLTGPAILCSNFQCKNGHQCLPYNKVCDGHQDCTDGSDEGAKCGKSCMNSGCQELCRETPYGPHCECPPGFQLMGDARSCTDIDECKAETFCSQYCTNSPGGFQCSCTPDYQLRDDKMTCKSIGKKMKFIYAMGNQIRYITQTYSAVGVIYNSRTELRVTGLDFIARKNLVFWTSDVGGTLTKINLDNKEEIEVITNLIRPTRMSVDWLTENVYFIENYSHIKLCHFGIKKCSVVYSVKSGNKIMSLAVDPITRLMFWSEENFSYNLVGHEYPITGIKRSDLAGVNITTIIDFDMQRISDIVVDSLHRVIYWLETHNGTVDRSSLTGTNRQTLFHTPDIPVELALFEDRIYWLVKAAQPKRQRELEDYGNIWHCGISGPKLWQCDVAKIIPKNILGRPYQFRIFHTALQQQEKNPCQTKNCSHLCVLTQSGTSCLCEDGTHVLEGENCKLSNGSMVNFITEKQPMGKEKNTISWTLLMIILFTFIVLPTVAGVAYFMHNDILRWCSIGKSNNFKFSSFHFHTNPMYEHGISHREGTFHHERLDPGQHQYENPMLGKGLNSDVAVISSNEMNILSNQKKIEIHLTGKQNGSKNNDGDGDSSSVEYSDTIFSDY